MTIGSDGTSFKGVSIDILSRMAILHRDTRDGEAAAFTNAEHAVDAYRGVGGGEGQKVSFASSSVGTAISIIRVNCQL
jgi:hypothetical protein